MTPNSPPPFEHAHHERTLVLRYVEDNSELTREERLLASALLRTCAWCAALGPEVGLIAGANRAMIVPPAGRDFRITPAQARGRRGFNVAAAGVRIRAALRTELVRPLAGAAVAVGLVIAVVGAVPYLGNPAPTPGIEAATGPANLAVESAAAPEFAVPTPEVNAAAGSSLGEPEATIFPQALETAGVDTSADTPPAAPSSLRIANGSTPSPSEAPEIANITAPAPSAATGDNSDRNNGSVSTKPTSAESAGQEPLPPLLIFGVLLAIVGLLVLGLTVLARRLEPAS